MPPNRHQRIAPASKLRSGDHLEVAFPRGTTTGDLLRRITHGEYTYLPNRMDAPWCDIDDATGAPRAVDTVAERHPLTVRAVTAEPPHGLALTLALPVPGSPTWTTRLDTRTRVRYWPAPQPSTAFTVPVTDTERRALITTAQQTDGILLVAPALLDHHRIDPTVLERLVERGLLAPTGEDTIAHLALTGPGRAAIGRAGPSGSPDSGAILAWGCDLGELHEHLPYGGPEPDWTSHRAGPGEGARDLLASAGNSDLIGVQLVPTNHDHRLQWVLAAAVIRAPFDRPRPVNQVTLALPPDPDGRLIRAATRLEINLPSRPDWLLCAFDGD